MKSPNDTAVAHWLTASDEHGHISTDAQWQRLTQEAVSLGFAGLVLAHASTSNISLPESCTSRLKQSAYRVATYNLNIQNKLETILSGFNEAGIDIMLLKGAALLTSLYDSPGLRPMSDVDLLCKAKDVAAVTILLEKMGCSKGMELIQENHFPTYYYESEFLSFGPNPIRLDVHVRPFRPLRYGQLIPEDQFWENARQVEIGQASAYMPCAETMLIHLGAHAAFHDCARLMWLYDLKRWCDFYGKHMNWSRVLERAKAWHLIAPLRQAIHKGESIWGQFVPKTFRHRLAGIRANWLDRLVLWQTSHDAQHPIRHLVVDLLTTRGIRFRLGYARNFLLPATTHLAEIYPYRHVGWRSMAHLWRGGRLALRPLRNRLQKLVV